MTPAPPAWPQLPELTNALSAAHPGLTLLRYRSATVLSDTLAHLHLPPGRPLHQLTYDPQGDHTTAPRLVEECARLASPAVPILVLRPTFPGPEPDLERTASFWKNLNAAREALGSLSARILLTLDEVQTPFAYHHGKDLLSWCSPKYDLPLLPEAMGYRLSSDLIRSSREGDSSAANLTWASLYPLLHETLTRGPLSAGDTAQLLLPLMGAALDAGAVTRARLLLPAGETAAFPNPSDRALWLQHLGDLALDSGNLPESTLRHTESKAIRERLADSDPAHAAWQRDLSVSLDRLGDLAVAQGDLAAALRYFSEAKAIAERLAASEPANAAWQRDLAVSHFKLYQFAEKKGDEALMEASLRACYGVLDGMKRRGMHLDPPMQGLYEWLAGMFGG